MRTLVVHESMWGNTRAVAEAIAAGVPGDVRCTSVEAAPHDLDGFDLLVVGGPTHAFSISRATTRHDALSKGAESGHEAVGIRDWLDGLGRGSVLRVATFDTRVASVRHLPGSAAKAAARIIRRRRIGTVIGIKSFYVADMSGPLLPDEVQRAKAWGQSLATSDAYRAQ